MPTRRAALRGECCRNLHHLRPGITRHRLQCQLELIPTFRQDGLVQARLRGSPIRQEPARAVRIPDPTGPPRHVLDRQFLQHHHGVGLRQLVGGFLTEILPAATLTRPHLSQRRPGLGAVGRTFTARDSLRCSPSARARSPSVTNARSSSSPALVATATTTPRSTPTPVSGCAWPVGASIPSFTSSDRYQCRPSLVRVAERITIACSDRVSRNFTPPASVASPGHAAD
jgi:hypothetical protein